MFPIDVTLIPVKWGSFLTPTGQLPRRVTVQVSPVLGEGTAVVWAATGDTLTTFRAVARDSEEVEFTVPAVDQDGWRDNTGAAFSEWSYEARAFVDFGSGVVEYTKFFQVREAYSSLDLALVPDGVPADPSVTPLPAVTSVNRLFGDVVIPQIEGKSAYEVAVENGFVGTEAQWLESLESTVPGPANSLAIGTVVEGPVADAVISGTAPNQTLSLMLPQADPGPPNSLAIGTVAEGPTAGATITGTSPSQTLNLVLPEADPGPPGLSGDIGQVVSLGNQSGALNLTSLVLDSQFVTLTAVGNLTLAAANMPSVPAGLGGSFSMRIKQDATGSRTLTTTGIKYAYGVAPVLTPTANAVDLLTFSFDGVGWCGFVSAASLA